MPDVPALALGAARPPERERARVRGRLLEVPGWEPLREVALGQHGLFSDKQAADQGVTPRLLRQLARLGRIEAVRWRSYRLTDAQPTPYEPMILAWLWSGGKAVMSHETALALHGLADPRALPVHLTIAPGFHPRHNRPPSEILLHVESLAESEVDMIHGLPAFCLERALAQSLRRMPRARIRSILDQLASCSSPGNVGTSTDTSLNNT